MSNSKIVEFIERGEKIKSAFDKERSYSATVHGIIDFGGVDGEDFDQWVNEVELYSQRNLKNNPFQSAIHKIYFKRRSSQTTYEDMMACLRAIKAETLNDIDPLAEMLSADIRDCKDFLTEPNDQARARKLYIQITSRYDGTIANLSNGLFSYIPDYHFYDPDISLDALVDNLAILVNRLEVYLTERKLLITSSSRPQSMQNRQTEAPFSVNPDEYYNLFVICNSNAYLGGKFIMPPERSLTEYVSHEVKRQFCPLNEAAISQIKAFPTLFVNENNLGENPNQEAFFGFVTDIKVRDNGINIYFQKLAAIPQTTLIENAPALAIDEIEFSRTHWTIKKLNLREELTEAGIVISEAVPSIFNINTHIFDVAVTFAGESRPLVKAVVEELSAKIASNRVFYDEFYQAYLARPSLDTLLQNIYHKRSRLIVAFLCKSYQEKEWCGLEFHAIRDIIKQKVNDKIMFIRIDDAEINGVFSTDGYIDARQFNPQEIAGFILQRLETLPQLEEVR